MEHKKIGKNINLLLWILINHRSQFERDKKLLKSNGRGLHEVLRQIKPSEFKASSKFTTIVYHQIC